MLVAPEFTARHGRRLRELWQSAGWPSRDPIELDLLAGGLLQRIWDEQGRESLRVTDAGMAVMAATRQRNRAARGAHEALVQRVASQMQRAGRLVWRGLRLRAPLVAADGGTRWAWAMPDVYSIRQTSVEDYVEPVAHEIKVSRADLLADLRRQEKGQAYLALASQCWYVVREGMVHTDEVPPAFGLMIASPAGLDVARPAPARAMRLPFSVWMALAAATADAPEAPVQGQLGGDVPGPG